ncbi:MAG: ATP-binding cassette domain-containing protein [Robiginitomaculum sp.]|nr:ATP-binding cassette domain-containing protein [Robiginitomaculum sp.]
MNKTRDIILELDNISKTFAGKKAVNNVSFKIKKGEIVGFLGPNGAGKTTSLRIALGLISPDDGDGYVKLFGGQPGPDAFGRVGFLPEERGLYRKISARDAIAHIAQLNGMKGRAALAQADQMLERYGLGEIKRKKIKTLSKGMAQKVQLIAAIAHDPEFLVLDEPFSGLDPVNQKLLEDMVREIAARGRTIIFSTHVMEHAERLCDSIILMDDGAKIFDGDLASALEYAPKKLVIEARGENVKAILEPFASEMNNLGEQVWKLILKPDARPQDVLQACSDANLKLIRFEPERPSLHDAFVNLVGESK